MGFSEQAFPGSDLAGENTWGFGQVVAVGILVLPFFTFFGKSSNFSLVC
jgi:hypothetical protein